MKPPRALRLSDLHVRYGKHRALDGVSLDVSPGEFMVLLGPSGCGKSTLLAALSGLEELQSGEVHIGERNVTRLDPADRNIAMVFQSYALYPTMNVAQNLSFGMRMRGVDRRAAEAKLAEVVGLLRLEPVLARRPAQLSGGQRQRVAIGRAMLRDPDLFLFDEPLSSLDAKLRGDMRAEIKLLHRRLGTTVLYVTHDQIEAMTMADRIAVMRDGKILQVGSPRAIYDRPQTLFVAGFVGSPNMNLLRGQIVLRDGEPVFMSSGLSLPLGHYAWTDKPADGRPVVLGVRPEDVGVANDGGGPATLMTATLVEPTGSDILLRAAFAGGSIVARVHRDCDVRISETISVSFDLRNVSVFCAVRESRL